MTINFYKTRIIVQHQKPESAEQKTAVTAPTMLVEVIEMGDYPTNHLTVTDNYRVFSDSLSATLYPRNSVKNDPAIGMRLNHDRTLLVHFLDNIDYKGNACVATITPGHLLLWKRNDLKPGINDKPFQTMSLPSSYEHPNYARPLGTSDLQSVHLFQDQKTIMGRTLCCPAKNYNKGVEVWEQVIWFFNIETESYHNKYTLGWNGDSLYQSLTVLPRDNTGYRFVQTNGGDLEVVCADFKNNSFVRQSKFRGPGSTEVFSMSQDAKYGFVLSPLMIVDLVEQVDKLGGYTFWPTVPGGHDFQERPVFLNHQLAYSKKGSNQWCMYDLDTGAVYETELKSDDYCRMMTTDISGANSDLFVRQKDSMKSIRFVPCDAYQAEIKAGTKQLPDAICRLISSYGIFVTPKYPNPGFSRALTLELTDALENLQEAGRRGTIDNICIFTLLNSIMRDLYKLKKTGALSAEEIQKCIDHNKNKINEFYPEQYKNVTPKFFRLIEKMKNEMLAQAKTATPRLA
jgi:hypothetical protein